MQAFNCKTLVTGSAASCSKLSTSLIGVEVLLIISVRALPVQIFLTAMQSYDSCMVLELDERLISQLMSHGGSATNTAGSRFLAVISVHHPARMIHTLHYCFLCM
jgi:hypothetical protein